MKRQLIALGCGFLLSLGVATATFPEARIAKPEGIAMYEQELLVYKGGHIANAMGCIQTGTYDDAIWHLNRILKKEKICGAKEKEKGFIPPTFENLAKLIVEVIDENIEEKQLRPWLLSLAEVLYEEEKIDIASHWFKGALKDGSEKSKRYKYADSHFYHIWIAYNMVLNETRAEEETNETVLEKTHSKVVEFYKKNNPNLAKSLDELFGMIKAKLPKGESKLIKHIKSYNH